MEPPLSLEELASKADIIFKGTALSDAPAQDNWFEPRVGFVVQETQFAVISVIKGTPPGATLCFRHYDVGPQPEDSMFQTQYYRFRKDQTYVVFAKKADDAASYRQLWRNHTAKEDQGRWWCADNTPVSGTTVKDVLWNELTLILKGRDAEHVTYAIDQLDQMSGGQGVGRSTQDFDRTTVLNSLRELMTNDNYTMAEAAIAVIGSKSPYISNNPMCWLAVVGSAELPGCGGSMNASMRNTGGDLYWKDLKSIADGKYYVRTRALAIRALGLVREPALREGIDSWLVDRSPYVRAAAALLLSDYPGIDANQQLTVLAGDTESEVRECVALAIGYSQQTELADLLGRLLTDKDSRVRRMASASLLSFSSKNEAVARVFRANLENKEFQPLFMNALARENPDGYLDALVRVIEEKPEPRNGGGGEFAANTSWRILFRYLQAQPAETLNSGKMDRYLDVLEKVPNHSYVEPRDLYALYVLSGMPERARKFREKAAKTASYNVDSYFNQVDQNPELFRRK